MSSQDVRMADASPERIAALPPQAGEARWWFGGLALIKLDSKQTEGRFSLIEVLWPPNLEVPLHVHTPEDELFHVLEGKISYRIGESRFEASPGHTLFAPKNVQHGQPAQGLTLPPNPYAPVDAAILERVGTMMATKYG